ncbi:helix-turn-helix domain-containing protein [Deinococcus sonorensis]|uniref:Helix-turn-helix domain-containing protein n=2 Tax=Deinococcus sonorensis TaxID=309891 RepID=A0AAU7UGD8_9DEIO
MSEQQQIHPDFLTVPQVARRLQLGRNTVYGLIRTRSIPSVRIGRSIRISRPVLERWLAQVDGQLVEVGQ